MNELAFEGRAAAGSPDRLSRYGFAALALVFVAFVGACCSAERTAATVEPERRNEVVTEPHGSVAPVTPREIDCAVKPERMCCAALTPDCIRCGEEAQAEADAWAAKCNEVAEPVPTSFDCSKPAPVRPCCRALLPKCTACAANNRAIEEAYRARCVAPPQ